MQINIYTEDTVKITCGRNTINEATPVQTEELAEGLERGGMYFE